MPITQITDETTGVTSNPAQQTGDYGPDQDADQTINNNFALVIAKLNEVIDAVNGLLNP